MTEAKIKRLIVAATVGAVLLIVILLTIMVYQLISASAEKKRIDELDAKILEYNELIKAGEETKEVRSLRWWIEREARQLGYTFEGDVNYKTTD